MVPIVSGELIVVNAFSKKLINYRDLIKKKSLNIKKNLKKVVSYKFFLNQPKY
jgi:hypothetical protein